jgi:hypothetical protein
MSTEARAHVFQRLVINILAGTGVLLYITLFCGNYLAPQDDLLKRLAMSITMLLQVVRGLLFQLNLKIVPTWAVLTKWDRRLIADTTVLFLAVWCVLEITMRNSVTGKTDLPIIALLLDVAMVLGAWLTVLNLKKSTGGLGIPLLATLVFMAVFLAPPFLAAGLAYGLYHYLHVQGQRDVEILVVSATAPLLIAVVRLMFEDKRDRSKNTMTVIWTQVMTLPAVPICFFILKAYWPEQISAMWLPAIILVLITIPSLFSRRTRPWLVKEKIEILERELSNKIASVPRHSQEEVQSKVAEIRQELATAFLQLKKPEDHIDRGDAFQKLGDLELELSGFERAETNYNEAIHAYNRALEMDPNNQPAIAHKFKTVESLGELKRRQFKA